jgi:NCS1 family nucleobase:cation symporter-1
MPAIVIGNVIATVALILSSLGGAYYHSTQSAAFHNLTIRNQLTVTIVGFPVFNRAVWGMWGSQFVIWNRIFLSFGMEISNLYLSS